MIKIARKSKPRLVVPEDVEISNFSETESKGLISSYESIIDKFTGSPMELLLVSELSEKVQNNIHELNDEIINKKGEIDKLNKTIKLNEENLDQINSSTNPSEFAKNTLKMIELDIKKSKQQKALATSSILKVNEARSQLLDIYSKMSDIQEKSPSDLKMEVNSSIERDVISLAKTLVLSVVLTSFLATTAFLNIEHIHLSIHINLNTLLATIGAVLMLMMGAFGLHLYIAILITENMLRELTSQIREVALNKLSNLKERGVWVSASLMSFSAIIFGVANSIMSGPKIAHVAVSDFVFYPILIALIALIILLGVKQRKAFKKISKTDELMKNYEQRVIANND